MSNKSGKSALSRRTFIGKLAAGAAVTFASAGTAAAMSTRSGSVRSGSAPHGAPNEMQLGALPQGEPEVPGLIHDSGPQSVFPSEKEPSTAPPWEMLRPLAIGSTVSGGWRVAGLTGVLDGSCVLTLENERGRSQRIHVCRNEGQPQGLVYTERLDLVVMNGGLGDLPTEEGLAQAVAEVAHVLAANEGERRHAEVMTALLPQAERVKRFAAAAVLR